MAVLTVMLSLFAASLVTINANDHQHSGIGFVGSRGKRSINTDDESNKSNDVLYKTDSPISNLIANYSDGSYRSDMDYMRNLPELSLFKRAPSGFLGMRGKKDYEYSDFVRREQLDESLTPEMKWKNFLLNNPNSPLRFMKGQFPKRAPSGFLGMRGKKLLIDAAAENNKRGPQGFVGMRGKKDILDLLYGTNNMNNDYPQFYENIRNEQKMLDDINHIYEMDAEDYKKRAPSAGFFGMRGKKLYEEPLYDDLDSMEKRAPSGFLGMRGKKTIDDYGFDGFEEEKRAPMGFLGMRGKKDVSAQIEEQKRSSLAQFFGIRGKKQPLNSGFFGLRGKKQPMEFRGKFVGVRGKKASSDSLQQLEEQLGNIENNELTESQSNTMDEHSKVKRAPNGFVGMRGKKWPDVTLPANQD